MNSEDKVIVPDATGKDNTKPGTKIKCVIEITQPDGEVVQVEASSADLLPELDKIDLSSRKGLMDFISMTDKGIIAIRNEAGKKAIEAYARKALNKNESPTEKRPIETECGVISLDIPGTLCVGMKPKEYLWSDEILTLIEIADIKMSNRVCCAFLNRMLHRNEADVLKMRTISDICTRHGNEILTYQDQHASDILAAHQFDSGTCKFTEETEIEAVSQEPSSKNQSDSASVDQQSQINDYITSYNAKKTDGVTIQMTTRQKLEIEISRKSTVYIALDGVCVKKQKEKRESAENIANTTSENTETVENLSASPKQKSRPAVETSVAHISFNEQRYILLAKDMQQLCLLVLAFLIERNMLKDMQLVFLTDGAKDIRNALEKVFYFRKYTVVLDWFHLVKHCSETVSMMLRTGKENRSKQYEIKRLLFRYLWCGNVQGAITYIRGLKSDDIRNEKRRTELIEYLERKEYAIPCYAVRRFLGLIVTSNPVEKANDLTVAHRQKKKSMSWSCRGSSGLAALTALYMNHEDTVWHSNHALSYAMYEKYHDGLVA